MSVFRNLCGGIILVCSATAMADQPLVWETIVNNGTAAPGGQVGAVFRSYNPPSLNEDGIIVFRARSALPPPSGGAQRNGIYRLQLGGVEPVTKLFIVGDLVPAPNNLDGTFNNFPSVPRVDPTGSLVASRGQHRPVWEYPETEEEFTRVGTAGVYAFPGGAAVTGASQLGAAVEADLFTLSFPWYSVPGALAGTRFDQFPGAPAVSGDYIIFKGNYTDPVDGLGRTGIYFRDVVSLAPVPFTGMIASSNLVIPNQPEPGGVLFGATAPPSAANGSVYFTGWDIEEAPTLGGIYRAPIAHLPQLEVVAGIGDRVPGVPGEFFRNFGEGLSVSSDGNLVSFWATWGEETFTKLLICPEDGNPELLAFCNEIHPDGLAVQIPVNQGIFVHDRNSQTTHLAARTGLDGVEDFVYWVFSGRVPGVGGGGERSESEDEEPARWRSSAFSALSAGLGQPARVAFQAQRNGLDGIYLQERPARPMPLKVIAEVGTTPGQLVDPQAPADSFISSVAIERDGFRSGRIAMTASMLYVDPSDPEESLSWAGLYTALVGEDLIFWDSFER